jgi:putative sterol carrier protein
MPEELKSLLEGAIGKFNAKAAEDPKLAEELEGVERKVMVDVTDGPKYNFKIENKRMTPILDGAIDAPDVTLSGDMATMLGLLKKEIKPMKAFALKKIRVKASLEDLMRLRKFF